MIAVLLIQWGLPLSNSKKNSQEKNSTRFLNKYSFSMKQVVLLRSVIFISDDDFSFPELPFDFGVIHTYILTTFYLFRAKTKYIRVECAIYDNI